MEKGLVPVTDAQLDTLSVTEPYTKLKDIMATLKASSRRRIPFFFDATRLAAPTSIWIVSPMKGDVIELGVVVDTQSAGAADVGVKIATVAVVGLTVTVPDASTVGTVLKTRIDPVATSAIDQDQAMEITAGAAFTAGALSGWVEVVPR